MAELTELQRAIAQVRADRGFTNDPLRIFTLLNEEVGEVARELKKSWSPNYGPPDEERIANELADCLVALCALATVSGVDLEAALQAKFFVEDGARDWASASRPVVDP